MKFVIEQLALAPRNVAAAKELLNAMAGMVAEDWSEDVVHAEGNVFGEPGSNTANLSFNYKMFAGKELEILDYTEGDNWIDNFTRGRNSVSHLGMHCTSKELRAWRKFFADRWIPVAQEVKTKRHTNPVIAGLRTYEYVVFGTKDILGVDIKFIVRIDVK